MVQLVTLSHPQSIEEVHKPKSKFQIPGLVPVDLSLVFIFIDLSFILVIGIGYYGSYIFFCFDLITDGSFTQDLILKILKKFYN